MSTPTDARGRELFTVHPAIAATNAQPRGTQPSTTSDDAITETQ